MRAKLGWASDWNREEFREIADLDALLSLIDEFNSEIVVGHAFHGDDGIRVTIYDDYLE